MSDATRVKDVSFKNATKEELVERLLLLQQISVELLHEVNRSKLLQMVVKKACKLLVCDAAFLYLKNDRDELDFEVFFGEGLGIDYQGQCKALGSKSLPNLAIHKNQGIKVDDFATYPHPVDVSSIKEFDEKWQYYTKSLMVYPLIGAKGEILGVIQLHNKLPQSTYLWPKSDFAKFNEMPTFNKDDEELLKTFAAMASAAIHNAKLYTDINGLLEGFVLASVDAIEARDQTTSGHSERVCILTLDMAAAINRVHVGEAKKIKFSDLQMKELRYACLLHDFGKIGVEEKLLKKAKKLYPEQELEIRKRLEQFADTQEIHILRGLLDRLVKEEATLNDLELAKEYQKVKSIRSEIEGVWKEILYLNQTTVLDQNNSKRLDKISQHKICDAHGRACQLLTPDELGYLSIRRGSLTDKERFQINMHVSKTYQFLKKIPWTKEFAKLPQIAHFHHEKLDGTGYPLGIKGDEIPVQSQMMAITDIFDALVAMDRPYKKAIPIEHALDILSADVKAKKLNGTFFDIFVQAKCYLHPDFIKLMKVNKSASSDDDQQAA